MEIDKLIQELKYTIKKYETKSYETFEPRVGDMATDCLKAILELQAENEGLRKTIEDMQRNLDAWNPRQSFNEPTTGNPMPQTSYTTSINKTDLADGKLR